MGEHSGWAHLDAYELKKDTGKAFLLVLRDADGTEREVWVPRSLVSDPDDYTEGDRNITISVRDWFAKKEGLSE